MTYATSISAARRIFLAAICGATLGGFLALASAQDGPTGQLDTACNARCTANGYEAEFCGQVCWIPDPSAVAKGEGLDWKCMTDCRKTGRGAEDCMTSCRRY